MKKNIRKIILILSLICLIILVTIIIALSTIKSDIDESSEDYDLPVEDSSIYEEELNQNLSLVQSENDFFTLESQIKDFFLYYKVGNKNAIYEILDTQYSNDNSITSENSTEILSNLYQEGENNYSQEIAYVRESSAKPIHYIKGTIENNSEIERCYITIYWDLDNGTYSIKPITENEYNQYISDELKEENNFSIEEKQYNELEKMTLTDEEKAEKYFKSYIKNALYNVEESYRTLDEEYRNAKFPNIDTYIEYLLRKKEELQSMNTDNIKSINEFASETEYNQYINSLKFEGLQQYSFTSKTNEKSCICIDYYGYNYIFDITGAMQYTVILDTYTLDLPEFIERYDAGNDQTKLTLNTGKIIEAINNKDYEYVYNKINETYRNNNFGDISTFEQFVNTNFYPINEVQDFTYRQEGSVYICTIGLKNKENESDAIKSIAILMELQDNRDFEISFSM